MRLRVRTMTRRTAVMPASDVSDHSTLISTGPRSATSPSAPIAGEDVYSPAFGSIWRKQQKIVSEDVDFGAVVYGNRRGSIDQSCSESSTAQGLGVFFFANEMSGLVLIFLVRRNGTGWWRRKENGLSLVLFRAGRNFIGNEHPDMAHWRWGRHTLLLLPIPCSLLGMWAELHRSDFQHEGTMETLLEKGQGRAEPRRMCAHVCIKIADSSNQIG